MNVINVREGVRAEGGEDGGGGGGQQRSAPRQTASRRWLVLWRDHC